MAICRSLWVGVFVGLAVCMVGLIVDMFASPAKIIGGVGGGNPSCSYTCVLLYTYRFMRKGFPSKNSHKMDGCLGLF